jgi:pyruvate formate lyase activating enzyme
VYALEKSIIGKIYDIQEFSVHDGPGVRTTVFMKGCPLRCPWCHSPESQSFKTQVGYTDVKCIGTELCGACLKVCKYGAITAGETKDGVTKAVWDRSKCAQCLACTRVCYPDAVTKCGIDYTVDEVIAKLSKSYEFFRNCKGGVTVSGGEPLCQADFVSELLKRIKADGIHTALDTTGYAPWEAVESVLPYVDLYLLDLKHMDSKVHNDVVKVPNELIHENALKIAAAGGKFQIRIPVIPGFNDALDNLTRTAEFCTKLGDAVETVQLLPYHHFGASKYAKMQMYDPMPADLLPPSDESMEEYRQLFQSYGLNAIIH